VMSRGNQRQAIFADDRDREVFLKTVGETCERTKALIYSYVLMGNHYHLLMNTPRGFGCGNAVASEHIHDALQCSASRMRASFRRTIQGDSGSK